MTLILGKEIRKEVRNKEKFFNEYLEETGKVYLEYFYKMNNANRDPEDRFRILLYPEGAKGKLVFYTDGLSTSISYKRIAGQLKEYCVALKNVKETEKEYRRIWKEIVRENYTGLNLIKVDFSKTLNEAQNQIGNNILTILDEKEISIREMSIDMNLDYAGLHRLVNKGSLENVTFRKILDVAKYLKVEIEDLYKQKISGGGNTMKKIRSFTEGCTDECYGEIDGFKEGVDYFFLPEYLIDEFGNPDKITKDSRGNYTFEYKGIPYTGSWYRFKVHKMDHNEEI